MEMFTIQLYDEKNAVWFFMECVQYGDDYHCALYGNNGHLVMCGDNCHVACDCLTKI